MVSNLAIFFGFTVQKSNILTILELRNTIYATSLELDHLSLAFLFSSQLEMFGSLDWDLMFPLASGALNPQDQLLGGLSLLPQDRLGLTAETLLLTVVPPSALGLLGLSRLLVLGHLELPM